MNTATADFTSSDVARLAEIIRPHLRGTALVDIAAAVREAQSDEAYAARVESNLDRVRRIGNGSYDSGVATIVRMLAGTYDEFRAEAVA